MREHRLMSGRLWHERFTPASHRFSYPLAMIMVNVDQMQSMTDRHPLWGRSFHPVVLRDRDYLDGHDNLGDAVRAKASELGLDFRHGDVHMLAQPRGLGWLFNPLVMYWHVPPGSQYPDAAIAEVQNTPWHEKHWYPLQLDGSGDQKLGHAKSFHVSPFMPMDMHYEWHIRWHDDRLSVSLTNMREGQRVFVAGMTLAARPATGRNLAAMTWRFMWQGVATSLRIYRQAWRLWRKRVPFYPHPDKVAGQRRG